VAFVGPDGLITDHIGGHELPLLLDQDPLVGRRRSQALQPEVASLLVRLVRRAFADRDSCDAEFSYAGAKYHARVSAQGPRRALCQVRRSADQPVRAEALSARAALGGAERRGFVQRLQQSVTLASLHERPLALGLVFLDGFGDISSLIDYSIGEQILAELLRRMPVRGDTAAAVGWYVGSLGEDVLGVVIEGSVDREPLRDIASRICKAVAQPVRIGNATFELTPSAGIAILGQDAMQPAALLEHARAAMLESRRAGDRAVHFYSDTLRMLPVARLDIERELREAIEAGEIGLRYAVRHDKSSGRVSGVQAYMRWTTLMRGEVPAAQFLAVAEATGLAVPLSRAVLKRLVGELTALRAAVGAQVPISFGALRQHVASGQLARDVQQIVPAAELAAGRFEIRLAERALAALSRPEQQLGEVADCGARVVIDELGRSHSSLAVLPRCAVWALQIDRALVVAARSRAVAMRSCRAIAALAKALEVLPFAAGVDDSEACKLMLEAGYVQGFGDHYVSDLQLIGSVARSLAR
jgi:predicted signal transduction protein with EAL and GGDEF domain